MKDIKLADTGLCAIVRDEMINPAGGVVDFIDSTMPFLEAGVVVDTGSLDGTREALEELETKYSNLKIYDQKFNGYHNARNLSLDKAESKMVLILDADERLTQIDFRKLADAVAENEDDAYSFLFLDVFPDEHFVSFGLNPRLFANGKNARFDTYDEMCWEYLKGYNSMATQLDIKIKHFKSYRDDMEKKFSDWYSKMHKKEYDVAPSQLKSFNSWKRFNHKRELFL